MGNKEVKAVTSTLFTTCKTDSDCVKDSAGAFYDGVAYGINYCCMYTKLITSKSAAAATALSTSNGYPAEIDYYSKTC